MCSRTLVSCSLHRTGCNAGKKSNDNKWILVILCVYITASRDAGRWISVRVGQQLSFGLEAVWIHQRDQTPDYKKSPQCHQRSGKRKIRKRGGYPMEDGRWGTSSATTTWLRQGDMDGLFSCWSRAKYLVWLDLVLIFMIIRRLLLMILVIFRPFVWSYHHVKSSNMCFENEWPEFHEICCRYSRGWRSVSINWELEMHFGILGLYLCTITKSRCRFLSHCLFSSAFLGTNFY